MFEHDELPFEQRIEFGAIHVELIRRLAHQHQRREFMRAQHGRPPSSTAPPTAGASAAFHADHRDVVEIEAAYRMLTPLLGPAAATCFLVSLMSAGISSSVVGTMAGQMIMQGFVGFRIPVWLRRLVTMAPAFVVVGMGVDSMQALVISQVVLSVVLPVPMLALIYFCGRRDVMGAFASGRIARCAALGATAVVVGLNAVLLAGPIGAMALRLGGN